MEIAILISFATFLAAAYSKGNIWCEIKFKSYSRK